MPIDPNYRPQNFRSESQPSAADIILGKLISTAKIQLSDRVRIIAIFDTSTYFMFFHEFEAATMRTPRSKWIWTKQYHTIYGNGMQQGSGSFYTLQAYADERCRLLHGSRVIIRRKIKSIQLRQMIEGVSQPLKDYQNPQPLPGQTFAVSSKISSGKRYQITKLDRAVQWQSWKANAQNKQITP